MFSLFVRSSIALIAITVLIMRDPVLAQNSIVNETLFNFNLITQLLREKPDLPAIVSHFDKYVLANNLEDSACYKDLKKVIIGIFNSEQWALSMLDAFGKPGANIIGGNIDWPGSYTECLRIKNESISGKYCWVKGCVSKTGNTRIKARQGNSPFIGICVPHSCDDKDLEPHAHVYQEILGRLGEFLIGTKLYAHIDCVQNPRENLQNDVTALIAILICCMLIAFVAAGTVLDVEKNPPTEIKGFFQFLKYFSIISNGKRLFSLENGANTFAELNGLKVFGMAEIIFGHTFINLFLIIDNSADIGEHFNNRPYQFLGISQCVELFFVITGFLTLYEILTKYSTAEINNTCKFIAFYILQRYLRMLIVPGIIMFLSRIALQKYFVFGPLWFDQDATCRTNWWQNVLFISNWWPEEDQCFLSWWFLSVSMQLHVIALIVIIPIINKKFNLAVFNGCALLIASWCWVGWRSYQTDLPPHYPNPKIQETITFIAKRTHFFELIFQTPIYHFGSFSTGMGLGWIIFKYKDGIPLTRREICHVWMLLSAILSIKSYGVYLEPNKLFKSLHTAFEVTAYSLCIAWLVIICHIKDGHNWFLNVRVASSVLRWKYWLPLSKLSLSVFLTHVTVIECLYLSELQRFTLTASIFWTMLIKNWVASYAVAILVTLTIEMPINTYVTALIKRLLLPIERRKQN